MLMMMQMILRHATGHWGGWQIIIVDSVQFTMSVRRVVDYNNSNVLTMMKPMRIVGVVDNSSSMLVRMMPMIRREWLVGW